MFGLSEIVGSRLTLVDLTFEFPDRALANFRVPPPPAKLIAFRSRDNGANSI